MTSSAGREGSIRAEPVAFGVGAGREGGEVDVDGVERAHRRGEGGAADRALRVAGGGDVLEVRDEALVGGAGAVDDVGCGGRRRRVEGLGEAADGGEQGGGHGRRDGVERGDGDVDRVGPGGEVAGAGGVTVGLRRVLAVVAGEIERVEVDERVPPMGLVLAELPGEAVLPGAQVRLVVLVLDRVAVPEPRETGVDAGL
jgi:hypothetical protein